MKTLPPRTYKANPRAEQKVIPFGVSHPAKMSAALCRDLFLRYTLPGQTVLDPFGGRGTSLVGITLGRNVILNELEPKFVEYIRQNEEHLRRHTLPGVDLGWADIHQGDSRTLDYLPDVAATITSPPYVDARGDWPTPAGAENIRYGSTEGQIGGLAHGDVAACISSPPYADVCERNRTEEPYSQQQDPALKAKYGTGDTNRHLDGYGETPGQIGALVHTGVDDACVSSPPFADSLPKDGHTEGYWQQAGGIGHTSADYGHSDGQIGALPHGGVVHAAVTSPPYASSAPNPLGRAAFVDGGINLDGGRLQPGDYSDYGHSDGQIGALPHGGVVHAAVTSPPYEGLAQTGGGIYTRDEEIAQSNMHEYGASEGQIGNDRGETYSEACLRVYAECFRVVRPGGVLVLVTGNYVRDGKVVDLAADTIALAQAAGWTPVERWRHEKATVSFWRRLHHRQGRPAVTHEDVLVFCKGERPAWDFTELPPTHYAPASLDGAAEAVTLVQRDLFTWSVGAAAEGEA